MNKKPILIRNLGLVVFSIVITLLLADKIGKPVENLEAGIYQKISRKQPQHLQYDSMGVPIVVYEGKLAKQYNTVAVAEEAIKCAESKDTSVIGQIL